MNIETLMLMLEDFEEIKRCENVEVYPVHSMETLDDLKQDAADSLWDTTKEYKSFGMMPDFALEDDWFINDNNLVTSISTKDLEERLLSEKEDILKLYIQMEEKYPIVLINNNEIRTELLKQFVYEVAQDSQDDQDYPEGSIILEDANIESIAEDLSEVTVEDLLNKLMDISSSGWSVFKAMDAYHLMEG